MTAESAPAETVDLGAYLRRIDHRGTGEPTLPALQALHLAHATHIPFENLVILLGRPIRVTTVDAGLVDPQARVPARDRLVLQAQLGLRVAPDVQPLHVRIDNTAWLADVGFGAAGLLLPIRFGDGAAVRQFAWRYRLAEEAGQWVLQSQRDGAWVDLYAFTLEPQLAVDFEVANHYVSTHPQSRFVQSLTAQRVEPEARHTLVNRDYSVDRGTETRRHTLRDDDELLELLAGTFGLYFPAGTRFRVPGTAT